MRFIRSLALGTAVALVASAAMAVPVGSASSPGTSVGHVRLAAQTTLKPGANTTTEILPNADTVFASTLPGRRVGINRRLSQPTEPSYQGPAVAGTPVAPPSGTLLKSWEGLNHFDTRFGTSPAGNNQFSTEPPDQGLCAGNGSVFESLNSVVAVYSATSGAFLSGPTDINSFYGYPFALNRTTGAIGPDVFDPTCYFDAATGHFFQLVSTLAVDSSGNFTGKSTIDLAVSATSNPVGTWNIYRIPAQNDGTDGTPNHGCTGGPCFPDYPHIGADANGIYITINEYPFFADGYNGVDIYALSKSQLAAGASSVNMSLTFVAGAAENAFTIWPAQSPGTKDFESGNGGTEYFLSSDAVFNDATGSSNHVFLWALTNTSSLSSSPALLLHKATVPVDTYVVPPMSTQKVGPIPLGQCINDTTLIVPGQGSGCWRYFFSPQDQPAHNEVEQPLDSNDSRMQQVFFADGMVWGALDTALSGPSRAGIAWYAITPAISRRGILSGTLAAQGMFGASGANNVTYPALGVRSDGKGVIAFTLVGPDFFPSAAYVTVSTAGTSSIFMAAAGQDPEDGFGGYHAFPPYRPRWGDYGAAVVDGSNVWIASEYIQAACTYDQWLASSFRCGDTRTSLANWSTRISQVAP